MEHITDKRTVSDLGYASRKSVYATQCLPIERKKPALWGRLLVVFICLPNLIWLLSSEGNP